MWIRDRVQGKNMEGPSEYMMTKQKDSNDDWVSERSGKWASAMVQPDQTQISCSFALRSRESHKEFEQKGLTERWYWMILQNPSLHSTTMSLNV